MFTIMKTNINLKHVFEFITFIVCGFVAISLFNLLYDNPMRIKGVPAYIGACFIIVCLSLVLPGILWGIRALRRKTQNFVPFINIAWVMLVINICFAFIYSYKCPFGLNAILGLLPVLLGMFCWFYVRNQKIIALSPSISAGDSSTGSGSTEVSDETYTKRSYNLAAKIFLAYLIVKQVTNIISNYSNLKICDYLGTEADNYIAVMIADIAIIIAACFSFKPRKYALISLIAILLIKSFAIFPSSNVSSYASGYMFGRNLANLFVDFAPFAIALCFKKDGVSGWRAFFANREKSNITAISESIAEPTPSIPAKEIPIPDSSIKEEPVITSTREKPIHLKIDWNKWKIPGIIAGAIIAVFAVLFFVVKSNNRIEYFYIDNNTNTAHLDRHCASGTFYVTSDVIFRGGYWTFCSNCISNRKMKQIEDSLACYNFRTDKYAYTKNIESVYTKLKRENYRDIGENVSAFAKQLLQRYNRNILLDINRIENFGQWGENLTDLESFLYGGYDLFLLDGDVRYIPHNETKFFKKFWPKAVSFTPDNEVEDFSRIIYEKLVESKYQIGTYQEFLGSLKNEEDLKWYYDKAKVNKFYFSSYDNFRKLLINDTKEYYKLWKALNAEYDIPLLDEFVVDMQDENNVKTLYNTLSKDGYTLPAYEEFQRTLEFQR